MAGAVALAVLGRMYMDSQKPNCRDILKRDMPPPCANVNRDKPRKTTVEPSQQVSNAERASNKGIPPSVNAAAIAGVPCLTPAREKTPNARCEEPKAGGELFGKPCDKTPKQVQKPPKPPKTIAKPDFQTVEETAPKPSRKLPKSSWEYILKAQLKAREKLLPFGCGEPIRKAEPIPRPCPEPEVPKEKKVCNKKKCVSIDPAKRRWPLVGNSTSAPKADSKCTCEPISPGRRRA